MGVGAALVDARTALVRQLRRWRQRHASLGDIFSDIYARGVWGRSGSRSGAGSNLEQTATLRAALAPLVAELEITSLLDIPCGDFFWMRHVDLGAVRYIGADIVPALIEELNASFASETRAFRVLDLTADALPHVDLILARDVLVHLSHRDAQRALATIKASNARYLATTTFTARSANPDIATGQWRPLNLQAPPFGLPAPWRLINEQCSEAGGAFADKCLGVWRVADLAP